MDETLTHDERMAERQEQLTREFLDTLKPQLEQLVASIVDGRLADLDRRHTEYDAFVRESQAQLRTDVMGWTKEFATHEETTQIGDRVGEYVTGQLSTTLETVVNKRFDEFAKSYATKDELTTVNITATAALEKATALEVGLNTRIDALEKRQDKAEDTQKEQVKTIQSIHLDTDKIGKSVDKMSTAIVELIARNEKQQRENEREIDALKIGQSQDVKEIREIRDQVSGLDSDVNGLRGDIATQVNTTRQNVIDMKSKVDVVDARQTRTETVVNEIQVSLQSALWLVNTRIGNAIVFAIIALLVGSNLVK